MVLGVPFTDELCGSRIHGVCVVLMKSRVLPDPVIREVPMLMGNAHLAIEVSLDDKRQVVVKLRSVGCGVTKEDLVLVLPQALPERGR